METESTAYSSQLWYRLLITFVAVLGSLVVVLALAQNKSVQEWFLNKLLDSSEQQYVNIQISRSSGVFPLYSTFEEVEVDFEDGASRHITLGIDTLRYRWKFSDLAKGSLGFDYAHILGVNGQIRQLSSPIKADKGIPRSRFDFGQNLSIGQFILTGDSLLIEFGANSTDVNLNSEPANVNSLGLINLSLNSWVNVSEGVFQAGIDQFQTDALWNNQTFELGLTSMVMADSNTLEFQNASILSNFGTFNGSVKRLNSDTDISVRRMEFSNAFYEALLPTLISNEWNEAVKKYSITPKALVGEVRIAENDIEIKELVVRQNSSQIGLNGKIYRGSGRSDIELEGKLLLEDKEIPEILTLEYPNINWLKLKDYELSFTFNQTPWLDRINLVVENDLSSPLEVSFSQEYESNQDIRDRLSERNISVQFNDFKLHDWLTESSDATRAKWEGKVHWKRDYRDKGAALDSLVGTLENLQLGEILVQNVHLNYSPIRFTEGSNRTLQLGLPNGSGRNLSDPITQDPYYRLHVEVDDDSGSLTWNGTIERSQTSWNLQSLFTMEELLLATDDQSDKIALNEYLNPESDSSFKVYAQTVSGTFNMNGDGLIISEALFNANTPLLQFPDTSFTDVQLYADYIVTADSLQEFRLTSTPLDFQLKGRYRIQDFPLLTQRWKSYLTNESSRWLLKGVPANTIQRSSSSTKVAAQQMEWQLQIKESRALGFILPTYGIHETSMIMNGRLNVDESRMLMNLDVFDQGLIFDEWQLDSLNAQWTASFRYDSSSLDFSVIESRGQLGSIEKPSLRMADLQWQASVQSDSIHFSNKIGSLPSGAFMSMNGGFHASDTLHTIRLEEFEVGSGSYLWTNLDDIIVNLDASYRLGLEQVSFHNNEEELDIRGIFSDEATDSMLFTIQRVKLDRLSDLFAVKQELNGVVDGQFSTRSLLENPSIQGELDITSFSLNQQIVGDIRLRSEFNPIMKRFDTNVTVFTDSLLYPDYFTSSERIGQNVELNGYFKALDTDLTSSSDTLYYFDLNFTNIDLWILPFLTPNVFSEMSGVASGTGSIWGDSEGYDFVVDYDIGNNDPVFIQPRFLETHYFGTGPLRFSSEEGLVFNDLFLMDPSGGTATLSGTYNLNRFGPLHTIDLTLEMDEFHFLNTSFDEELPFFGQGYGTATLRMTGTNDDPVLFSEGPIMIGDYSSIGLPLLEKTEFEENNKFIRFIDDFSLISDALQSNRNTLLNGQNLVMATNEERSFTERFTLDLQFESSNPMTIQLIFDPITGDVITANGTGNIRIQLQDEDFSVFGQFDIANGYYNFVSGDIFTRRFALIPGGTLRWDGDPIDAKLDLQALYQARPDINTLTRTRDQINQDQAERVPVELVLNIGGSLESIENDFFFRLPNTFETQQNSTLKTQINALNRNEDEKLIQATSFLLMGDFIPSSTALTDATNTLTSNLSGSAAVLNPLLSSQLISPLLSNQMNSLLRSDVGSLDIDFNLNTYNNIDLGVALRLYNDRIILSREGQITGSQSSIGDIGATYKINQALALTAFHRQDPTFSNYSGSDNSQQSQDINGVGLETEWSFSSWKQFWNQLFEPIVSLFNRKDEEILVHAE